MTLELAHEAAAPAQAQDRGRHGPLWHLTLMRARELWRQPATLFWVFGFPLLLSVGLGTAFQSRQPEPVVVASPRPLPPETEAALHAAGVDLRLLDADRLDRELRNGRVAMALVPPEQAGAPVEYQYDPTRIDGRLARALVNEAIQTPSHAALVPVRDRLTLAPGSRYIDFLIPGLLGMNLMTGALWGIGWSLVDLRARKLLRRLRVSPMRASQLVFAVGLARLAVIPLEVVVILGFGRLVFGMPMTGSPWALAAVVAAGVLAFSGIAALLGSRTSSPESATGMVNLVMLPMYLLSGVFFSARHFPEAIQPWIRFLPLSALNDGLRAVVLDGAGLSAISSPVLILAAWAAATFTLGIRLFRWV